MLVLYTTVPQGKIKQKLSLYFEFFTYPIFGVVIRLCAVYNWLKFKTQESKSLINHIEDWIVVMGYSGTFEIPDIYG